MVGKLKAVLLYPAVPAENRRKEDQEQISFLWQWLLEALNNSLSSSSVMVMWEWLYQQQLSQQCHRKEKGMLHTRGCVKTEYHGLTDAWGIAASILNFNAQQQIDLSPVIKQFANVFLQLLLFIEMLRKITLKSIPWMKMNEDCWECLNSHSCAQTEAEFQTPILYFHMCDAVSLSAREVKTEFLLQGQWKSQIQVTGSSSDLVSVLQEHGWERPFTPVCNGPTLSQCTSLLNATATRFRLILYVLYLHIKDVYSCGLLVLILTRRQTHAGSWSHRWEML